MDEASLDHAQTLRGLAGGVFRGLHEAPALESGAAALESAASPAQDGDAAVACGLDALASDGLRWAESEGLVRDAARRLRRPAPKVLAEAWGLLYADGKLTVVEDTIGSGPLLFETREDAETECGQRERVVRVQVVEVPSWPAPR